MRHKPALDALAAHESRLTVREAVDLRKLKLALQARLRQAAAGAVGPEWGRFFGVFSIVRAFCPNDSGRDTSGLSDRSYGGSPSFFVHLSRAPCRRNTGAERYCGSKRLTLPPTPLIPGQFFCGGDRRSRDGPYFFIAIKRYIQGMVSSTYGRGRPLNALAAFIHPCQPDVQCPRCNGHGGKHCTGTETGVRS